MVMDEALLNFLLRRRKKSTTKMPLHKSDILPLNVASKKNILSIFLSEPELTNIAISMIIKGKTQHMKALCSNVHLSKIVKCDK